MSRSCWSRDFAVKVQKAVHTRAVAGWAVFGLGNLGFGLAASELVAEDGLMGFDFCVSHH